MSDVYGGSVKQIGQETILGAGTCEIKKLAASKWWERGGEGVEKARRGHQLLPRGDGYVEERGRGELCGEQGHYAGLRQRRTNLWIVLGGEGGVVVRVRDQRMCFSQDPMSFDTNRSSIHGAAAAATVLCRASMDHREPVKTLEMDTARPFSYSMPRRRRRLLRR